MVSPSIAVCARALVGLMRLFYAGMLSPSIAAYPSEPEVWWHFHAQSPATPTSLVIGVWPTHMLSLALLTGARARGRSSRAGLRRGGAPACSYEGMPSTPGWDGGELDLLTEWAVAKTANRPIVCEYNPDAAWLWSKWRGTVLSLTASPVLLNMGVGIAVDYASRELSAASWSILSVPPAADQTSGREHVPVEELVDRSSPRSGRGPWARAPGPLLTGPWGPGPPPQGGGGGGLKR